MSPRTVLDPLQWDLLAWTVLITTQEVSGYFDTTTRLEESRCAGVNSSLCILLLVVACYLFGRGFCQLPGLEYLLRHPHLLSPLRSPIPGNLWRKLEVISRCQCFVVLVVVVVVVIVGIVVLVVGIVDAVAVVVVVAVVVLVEVMVVVVEVVVVVTVGVVVVAVDDWKIFHECCLCWMNHQV